MATWLRRWAIRRHLSVADERFGLRLGAGLVVTPIAAVAFVVLLLLVRGGWPPLRDLDAATAEALNRIGIDHQNWSRRPRSSATSSTRTYFASRSR